jgi:hypothetical protein
VTIFGNKWLWRILNPKTGSEGRLRKLRNENSVVCVHRIVIQGQEAMHYAQCENPRVGFNRTIAASKILRTFIVVACQNIVLVP